MEELLKKYIEKEATNEERALVIKWIKATPENQRKFNLLKAQYVANSLKDARDTHSDISFDNLRRKDLKRRRLSYASYAAVALIFIFSSVFFYREFTFPNPDLPTAIDSNTIVIKVENGPSKKVELPDGSTVLLNFHSQIEFPRSFDEDERVVSLIGEGLFDIEHNPARPFIVKTQDFDIKVLGTSFNVKSYPNDIQTETTLITGKVEVLRAQETPIVLAPSQKAVYHKTQKKIAVEKVASQDVTAWQNGTLVFSNTPMQQVALDLERKHNVKIVINSPKLLQYEYTGTFDNLNLEESLQLLMISSPIRYTIKKNIITLDME